ncbi:MAG: leucine--tRNA ligase, partial [Candidatus Micrarchaeota archaeon]|nr:leucine--tRNA ligase [Candidatus Micrarchaeota archaeon]
MTDYVKLDQKWQAAWAEAKLYESDVSTKEPYMITVAFPYVNGPQHIGHMRTFGTADVLARYMRMKGKNVLFPMGFHATGTPILAFAKRIKNNDPELIADLKIFHIHNDLIAKMIDPLFIANFFMNEIEYGMHRAGYSIDWRRKFISIDAFFSKFIEWQFGILNKRGYLVKGKHPVGWCPNENQAVGMHDTKRDVQPDIEKEVSVKFKIEGEDAYILCTTFRPETIYGVTNLFVNEQAKYAVCKIDNQPGSYYISKAAADSLKYQLTIKQEGEITGHDLLSKKCTVPMSGNSIPIFPGFFVKEDTGTGAVMSVPAHAPFDYAALEKLKKDGYAVNVTPIKVLEIPSDSNTEFSKQKNQQFIDMPALAYINLFGNSELESDALESATKLQYKEEFHSGKMIIKGYEGLTEPQAREKVTKELLAKSDAIEIYALANAPITCRCGFNVVVNVVEQWFLNYGDKGWKKLAKEAFSGITVLPDKSRVAFESAIDWIDLRAVARAQGLGTKFPLDKNYIIESLSDSTIYMSFYTISNLIRGVEVEKLKPQFFDYVFLNVGDPSDISEVTGIDYQLIKRCRESFDYWYKSTSRHSGPDLIFNHLTMYIFNHSTI